MPDKKCAPIPARNTLGDHASAQPLPKTTVPTPAAAALRKTVPTLPGSCTPSKTTQSPLSGKVPASGISISASISSAQLKLLIFSICRLKRKNPAFRHNRPQPADFFRRHFALGNIYPDWPSAGLQENLKQVHALQNGLGILPSELPLRQQAVQVPDVFIIGRTDVFHFTSLLEIYNTRLNAEICLRYYQNKMGKSGWTGKMPSETEYWKSAQQFANANGRFPLSATSGQIGRRTGKTRFPEAIFFTSLWMPPTANVSDAATVLKIPSCSKRCSGSPNG